MSNTGGGPGTNQYQVRGTAKERPLLSEMLLAAYTPTANDIADIAGRVLHLANQDTRIGIEALNQVASATSWDQRLVAEFWSRADNDRLDASAWAALLLIPPVNGSGVGANVPAFGRDSMAVRRYRLAAAMSLHPNCDAALLGRAVKHQSEAMRLAPKMLRDAVSQAALHAAQGNVYCVAPEMWGIPVPPNATELIGGDHNWSAVQDAGLMAGVIARIGHPKVLHNLAHAYMQVLPDPTRIHFLDKGPVSWQEDEGEVWVSADNHTVGKAALIAILANPNTPADTMVDILHFLPVGDSPNSTARVCLVGALGRYGFDKAIRRSLTDRHLGGTPYEMLNHNWSIADAE